MKDKEFVKFEQTNETILANNSARLFCFDFNLLPPNNIEKREELLRMNLGAIGANSTVLSPFHCDFGSKIFLGNNVFINYNCVILDMHNVHIGNNVMIAPNVTITTAFHSKLKHERRNRECLASPIIIEDDVWIGCNVSILPGVKIGAGSIIGSGAVVTKDVEPDSLVVGIPGVAIEKIVNK